MPTAYDNEARTLTVEQVARALGISRSLAYEQARKGSIAGIPVLRVGARLLVPRAAVERTLAGEINRPDSVDSATCE